MRKLLPVFFILISSVVSAQKQTAPSIDIRVINSKFQFVSKTSGQPVNTQLWDEVDPFVNGFARVFLNNKFSFVDDKGKLISPVNYEDARNFAGNLASVKKDGKWGCINESGNTVLPFNYEILFDFDGTVTAAYSNRKWWLVNNKGVIITQLDISVCFGFKNGVAKITRNDKEGILYPDGRIVLNQAKPIVNPAIPYHPNPNSNSSIAQCPDNINFEYGDFTNWQCYTGQVDSIGTTNVITVTPSPPTPNRHTIISRILPSALDPFGLFPTNPPDGSNFAVKLGNTNVGAEAERITYAIHIPLNDSNFSIKYNYAVVLQDPGHTIWTQPRFNAQLRDSATGLYIDCASFEYISTSGLPGFDVSPVNSGVIYKPWSSVFYSLRGYAGKTIYLEFTTADCVRRAHWGYAYVDVESTCGSPVEVHYDCTYPNATTLTAPPGFQFYNWWDQTYSTLLGSGQQLNMNPGPAVNSIIWLEMIPFNNFGCKDTLMININGDFDAEFDMSADNGCAPQTFTFYNRNLPSTTTLWNFGDGNTATGDTVTHTYSIPGTYRVTLDVTVPGGCNGTALHPITIYPTPNVVQPPNQTLCNGATTNAINFTGTPSSTIFNWTNNNPSIGLPASGTGDILSFTAINTGNIPETAIITVTPTHLTCPGTPKTFTITVNPSPDVNQPANQTLCNNAVTNPVNFTGTLSGTSFSWTNDNTSIGLSAGGNGNIGAFAATNTGNTPVTATITVTASTVMCPGTTRSFTITVNPVPDVVQPVNQTLCNGATSGGVTFTGSVSGTTFSWTNNNTSIGLPASGNGNIPAFTGMNSGSTPVTANIIVTPVSNGCPGVPRSFTITVYPTPDVLQPVDQTVCNGASSNAINFSGSVTGTQFSWINNNTTIGLPASGNGNISAFMVTNSTNVPITASITVIPAAVGCLGTPKTFTITVKPTPDVNRPADQTVCNATMTNTVNFNGSVVGTVFNWTNNNTTIGLAASGTGDIAPFSAITYFNNVNTGTIIVTPAAVGCAGTPESFAINVNPTPDLTRPQDQAICSGLASNAIIFNSSVNGTVYNWTNTAPAIGLPASGTGNIASFVASSNGSSVAVATITVTPSAMGCPGPSKNFTITVNPIPSVAQPVDQTLCNGTSTNMVSFTGSLSNISTYSWTNNKPSIGLAASGTGDIAPFTAINNSNVPVTATITVTPSANSCPGPAKTFTITINPPPAINAGSNQNVCLGNSTSLSATGAIQYLWSPATGLSCTTCPNPLVTPVDSVSYTVRGESNLGCFAFDTVLLTVSRPFQMLISPDDTLCIGESANLRASGANNYLWSPPQGLNRTDIADPTATPNATTLYRVVGYDGRNCFTDTSFVRLIVGPRPTVNIGADLTLSTGSVVTLNPVTQNGPIINWLWTPSTGLSCADCPNPTLTVRDNTYYELTVTNNYGCKATDIIAVNTFCKSAQVFVPNAFTPDGDGLNDILMVRGKGIFVKTFRIFNRWGELIFERTNFNPNDPKFGWDGKIRGIPATPDVFVYTAEVVCDNDVMYTYKGNTTLLK
jgi:gliding motility-associated-like protein